MSESGLDCQIQQRRREQLQRISQARPGQMTTNRELTTTPTATGYEDLLPRFKGKTISELIGERTDQGKDVSVLDIGCGEALFLARLAERFPRLKANGLSAADYRGRTKDPQLRSIIEKVDYRIGDAHDLTSIYPDGHFTHIVSVETFQYITDPIVVLGQAYSLLEKDGVMLIHNPRLPIKHQEVNQLEQYWKERGVQATLTREYTAEDEERNLKQEFFAGFPKLGLTIVKNDLINLPLPFKLREPTQDFWSYFELNLPRQQ